MVRLLERMATGEEQGRRLVAFHFMAWLNRIPDTEELR